MRAMIPLRVRGKKKVRVEKVHFKLLKERKKKKAK